MQRIDLEITKIIDRQMYSPTYNYYSDTYHAMYSISVITEMLFMHMRYNNNNIVATSKTNKADSYLRPQEMLGIVYGKP